MKFVWFCAVNSQSKAEGCLLSLAPFSKGVPSADGGRLPGLMSESPGPAGPPPLKRGLFWLFPSIVSLSPNLYLAAFFRFQYNYILFQNIYQHKILNGIKFFYQFSPRALFAIETMSLMRFSWLIFVAPGS